MVKYRIQARNIVQATSAAASTCTLELPIGQRYHSLHCVVVDGTATTVAAILALISQVRVKLNGRVQRTISGAELEDMNALNGATYGALLSGTKTATIPIYLAEPWRKDARDQDALAWPTRWKNGAFESFQVEIDFTAANLTVAVSAFAIVDNFVPDNSPQICKWLRQSFAAAGTSFDISTIDRRDFLTQVSLYADSGAALKASKVTVRINGQIVHELTVAALMGLLKHYGMDPLGASRTGGASCKISDIVFDHDDLLGSAINLNGASDITLTVEAASAMSGTVTTIVQRIGPPE
jgi:hypothetical protein